VGLIMAITGMDAALALAWMRIARDDLVAASGELTQLDAARGDADHGVNMVRGFQAIDDALALQPPATAGQCLITAATALRKTMGGTSGPLWSAALRSAGRILGTVDPAPAPVLGESLSAAAGAVSDLGGAVEGDNTMLDALAPAARVLTEVAKRGWSLVEATRAAAEAAEAGACATAGRVAVKGRASYLGERSWASADPGATSAAIIVRALYRAVSELSNVHR
jgi:dihydroxyacetone kinase-like protein